MAEEDFDDLPALKLDEYEPLPYDGKQNKPEDEGFEPKAGWSEKEKGPPDIDVSELQYDDHRDFLGEGTFGKVFKGRCRGQEVAIKVPANQNLSKEELEDFRREVFVMSKIFHPNVVLFMGACTQEGKIRIVTELMTTDLETFLKRKGKKEPLYNRLKMAKDAALGMNWLHGISKTLHRDLKTANLLVDQHNRVKVTDFGFAQQLKKERMRDKFGPRGTALWMAPEVMKHKDFDASIDIYSFGIVLWEIYTTEEPFSQYSEWEPFYEAVCVKNARPPIDDECPTSLRYLIEACWSSEPSKRPTFAEVVFRLDEVLADVAIADEKGAHFWKKHFLQPKGGLQEKVSWNDFKLELARATKIKERAKFETLKSVIVKDGKVTIERFNQCSTWFGHFYVQGEADAALEELKKIVQAPWYHGEIEKDKAEMRLHDQSSGTFLVRLSTTFAEYPFTISLIKKQHKRIKRVVSKSDGSIKFSIMLNDQKTMRSFETVTALIEGVAKDLNLKKPCPQPESLDPADSYLY